MAHGTFSTILGCMDGRCQQAGAEYAHSLFGTDHYDTITEPGIDGILAGAPNPAIPDDRREGVLDHIRVKAGISANAHGAKSALILGHCECAGNPVERAEHEAHLRIAKGVVDGWGLFERIEIATLDEDWKVQPIANNDLAA